MAFIIHITELIIRAIIIAHTMHWNSISAALIKPANVYALLKLISDYSNI
jgi:hypothetical protein